MPRFDGWQVEVDVAIWRGALDGFRLHVHGRDVALVLVVLMVRRPFSQSSIDALTRVTAVVSCQMVSR